jgi:hypothetical protein
LTQILIRSTYVPYVSCLQKLSNWINSLCYYSWKGSTVISLKTSSPLTFQPWAPHSIRPTAFCQLTWITDTLNCYTQYQFWEPLLLGEKKTQVYLWTTKGNMPSGPMFWHKRDLWTNLRYIQANKHLGIPPIQTEWIHECGWECIQTLKQ